MIRLYQSLCLHLLNSLSWVYKTASQVPDVSSDIPLVCLLCILVYSGSSTNVLSLHRKPLFHMILHSQYCQHPPPLSTRMLPILLRDSHPHLLFLYHHIEPERPFPFKNILSLQLTKPYWAVVRRYVIRNLITNLLPTCGLLFLPTIYSTLHAYFSTF